MTWLYFAVCGFLLSVVLAWLWIHLAVTDAIHRFDNQKHEAHTIGTHGRNPGDGQKDS